MFNIKPTILQDKKDIKEMAVHDNLPKGIQKSIGDHISGLEDQTQPVLDTLATLKIMAPALLVGLDDEINSLYELVDRLKGRWGYYVARGSWASDNDVVAHMNNLPRASAATPPVNPEGAALEVKNDKPK